MLTDYLLFLVLIILFFYFISLIFSSKKSKDLEEYYKQLTEKRIYEYKNNYSSISNAVNSNYSNNENINFSLYHKKDYFLTSTELDFYKQLLYVANKLNVTVFTQVNLERLINVYGNNQSYRNRIKSRSIDFVIVNNFDYKVICCIELDDYTHNKLERQKRDLFINKLFESVNLKLYRIIVGHYDKAEIEKMIKEAM